MRIGLDVHGVIDRYPQYFQKISKALVSAGHEVHIITGQPWSDIGKKVDEWYYISHTHHFSIVDHHAKLGTKMWQDEKKTWWMEEQDWNRSKGDYIHVAQIDVHFDDNWEYVNWIPDTCTTIIVPKTGFHNIFVELATIIKGDI